jgi:hypothetical protein
VRERLGPELYRVAAGGRILVATSAFPLEPGSVLGARVERSGGGVALRLAPGPAAAGAPAAPGGFAAAALPSGALPAGMPGDAAARAAAAALLREGVAPEPRALARVRRAALRDADSGGDSVELAARMEAKGIPSEEAALGELLALFEGRGDGARERGGREQGQGGKDEAPADAPPGTAALGDLDRDFSLDLDEEEFPRRLAVLLRAMAMRVGEGGDSLALFNHSRGPEGHWLVLPFRFDADSVAFKGGLRIQLPYAKGGSGRVEAIFRASRGSEDEEWSLSACFGGGRRPSLRLAIPAGSAAGERARSRIGSLASSLASLACSVRLYERGEGEPPSASERGGLDLDA